MQRRFCLTLLWLLLPLAAWAQPGEVRATLDRSEIQLGDTVMLNVDVDGLGQASPPDLSALAQNFNNVGTSTRFSMGIVNGTRTTRTTFSIALQPKSVGKLEVPALNIAGRTTTPLALTVTANAPSTGSTQQRPVFAEASVDTDHAVVGQQLSYVLRLYYAVELSDGSLDDPQADGVQVNRLDGGANTQVQRGGTSYHLVERHYAIFPQRAGSLTIPAVAFRGQALDSRNPDAFFADTTPVSGASNPVTIQVAAPPAEAATSAWLPARALKLELEGIPADGKARTGQPITLNLGVEATGLPFEALPALTLPKIDGADVYPDKAVTGTRNDGTYLIGRRQQSFAVVPGRAGTLTIPPITLRWWNVKTGQAEVATVPGHTLQVEGGAGDSTPSAAAGPTVVPAAASPAVPVPAASGWQWLALAALVLWLLTVLAGLGWWWGHRKRKPAVAATVGTRGLRKAFLDAAAGDDSLRQEQTLLAWAREARPGLRSLGELSAALASVPQREAIARLQRQRFAGGEPVGSTLAEAFAGGFGWLPDGKARSDDDLPPLYP